MARGKQVRLSRIFRKGDGRAVVIALDHGAFTGSIAGLEDPVGMVGVAAEAGADAVIITPGTMKAIKEFSSGIGFILRIDGGQTSLNPSRIPFSVPITSVENALALGCDAVIAMGYVGSERETESLEQLGAIVADCELYGVPVIAEMLPSGEKPLEEMVSLASRVGFAMGADVIKTKFAGSVEGFKEVVRTTRIPILVAGGPRTVHELDALRVAEQSMKAGASGVAFGRNVFQSRSPEAMIEALISVIHGGETAREAAKIVEATL